MNYPIDSISKGAKAWLKAESPSRALHVFKKSCNLINEEGDIFSLVSPIIRNGPFSAVLTSDNFTSAIQSSDKVSIENNILRVGTLTFDAGKATEWESRINWSQLNNKKAQLLDSTFFIEQLIKGNAPSASFAELVLPIPRNFDANDVIFQKAEASILELFDGLGIGKSMAMRNGAKSLAGLGIGLTPAGDDFLVGLMLALFAWEKDEKALEISSILAQESMPLTNSISAAWLRATSLGEAGESWHDLVAAIAQDQKEKLAEAVMRILPTGHTSGADALGAFVATIRILSERGEVR